MPDPRHCASCGPALQSPTRLEAGVSAVRLVPRHECATGRAGPGTCTQRTIAQRDLLLICCVAVEIADEQPTAAADADEVRLAHPDRALVPKDWPARELVEELLSV